MADENKKNYTLALLGNPNVGKSTLFNELTGLNQHTGNWSGKTVEYAAGTYKYADSEFTLIDLPGIYSLIADSGEEKISANYIMYEKPDAIICIVDATCIERNLNLVIQALELSTKVIVCVNLLDEAKKKGIEIDFDELSLQLGIPVIGIVARSGEGIEELKKQVYSLSKGETKLYKHKILYNEAIKNSLDNIKIIAPNISNMMILKSIENNDTCDNISKLYLGNEDEKYKDAIKREKAILKKHIDIREISKYITEASIKRAEEITKYAVKYTKNNYNSRDRRIDKFFTSPITGIPVMILLMALIFWITITGANYPSEILFNFFENLKWKIYDFFVLIDFVNPITEMLLDGMYSTLTWVISVMLPPMAIFFPLFTILEDFGYLPRVAFNLDTIFKNCGAHGKQSLTMLMGFGCNACGVTGCRIINSPKEKIIAILTNNFVPCNGRFPTIISIITIFFVGTHSFLYDSIFSTLILVLVILFGICVSLLVSKILSKYFLKETKSDFVLELPPYRIPQIGKVIVRSVLDRVIYVLGRAIAVAAPAGVIIWICANIRINNSSILMYITDFLDPLGKVMGMDGTILTGFILGFPANEIVLPIILMAYQSAGMMIDISDLNKLSEILQLNGWTPITAICVIVFLILHFPCSTTVWTIYKETKSFKWTALSILIPTVCGVVCTILINLLCQFIFV